jgi:hypothetical protein
MPLPNPYSRSRSDDNPYFLPDPITSPTNFDDTFFPRSSSESNPAKYRASPPPPRPPRPPSQYRPPQDHTPSHNPTQSNASSDFDDYYSYYRNPGPERDRSPSISNSLPFDPVTGQILHHSSSPSVSSSAAHTPNNKLDRMPTVTFSPVPSRDSFSHRSTSSSHMGRMSSLSGGNLSPHGSYSFTSPSDRVKRDQQNHRFEEGGAVTTEFLNPCLLSNLAIYVKDQVPKGVKIKGAIEYPRSFTGKDVVVRSFFLPTRLNRMTRSMIVNYTLSPSPSLQL